MKFAGTKSGDHFIRIRVFQKYTYACKSNFESQKFSISYSDYYRVFVYVREIIFISFFLSCFVYLYDFGCKKFHENRCVAGAEEFLLVYLGGQDFLWQPPKKFI